MFIIFNSIHGIRQCLDTHTHKKRKKAKKTPSFTVAISESSVIALTKGKI